MLKFPAKLGFVGVIIGSGILASTSFLATSLFGAFWNCALTNNHSKNLVSACQLSRFTLDYCNPLLSSVAVLLLIAMLLLLVGFVLIMRVGSTGGAAQTAYYPLALGSSLVIVAKTIVAVGPHFWIGYSLGFQTTIWLSNTGRLILKLTLILCSVTTIALKWGNRKSSKLKA